jgi:hypothetical protein
MLSSLLNLPYRYFPNQMSCVVWKCKNLKILKIKSKNGYRFESSCFVFPEMDFVSIYRSLFSAVALKPFKERPKITNGVDFVIQILPVPQDSSPIRCCTMWTMTKQPNKSLLWLLWHLHEDIFSETPVTIFQSILWDIPEDLYLQQHLCEDLRLINRSI